MVRCSFIERSCSDNAPKVVLGILHLLLILSLLLIILLSLLLLLILLVLLNSTAFYAESHCSLSRSLSGVVIEVICTVDSVILDLIRVRYRCEWHVIERVLVVS